MINGLCYNNSYKGTRPVLEWYNSFVLAGKAADYTSRRGSSFVTSVISFEATGPKSFQNGRKFYFNDNYSVNNGIIKAIELIDNTQLEFIPAQGPNSTPLEINTTSFKNGYIVICDSCNNEILKLPLSMLNKTQAGGKLCFFNIKDVYLNNCYIQFMDAVGVDETIGYMFQFYIDPK